MRQGESGSRIRALITGTGRYVPDDVWTSDMVEARVDESSDGWQIPKGIIRLATGVGERRYAPDGVCPPTSRPGRRNEPWRPRESSPATSIS